MAEQSLCRSREMRKAKRGLKLGALAASGHCCLVMALGANGYYCHVSCDCDWLAFFRFFLHGTKYSYIDWECFRHNHNLVLHCGLYLELHIKMLSQPA